MTGIERKNVCFSSLFIDNSMVIIMSNLIALHLIVINQDTALWLLTFNLISLS